MIKRFVDIILWVLLAVLIILLALNTEIIFGIYETNVFGMDFEMPVVFYILLLFIIYIIITWSVFRFSSFYWATQYSKVNKELKEVLSKIESLEENIWNKISAELEAKISENTKEIKDELGIIKANLWYLNDSKNSPDI